KSGIWTSRIFTTHLGLLYLTEDAVIQYLCSKIQCVSAAYRRYRFLSEYLLAGGLRLACTVIELMSQQPMM
ncbi:hypothetical protein, partial [Nostoc sp. CALU 1950]|uniref:hypothetical protein n=1 Tax=Nostoc sp. CALU 1950 TaxID=3104321 RepID=UPI003EB86BE7